MSLSLSPGSGNVLKVQQLLHICSEHYEAKEKEKEEDKDKKDKKDKDKKDTAADMGSHQVTTHLLTRLSINSFCCSREVKSQPSVPAAWALKCEKLSMRVNGLVKLFSAPG